MDFQVVVNEEGQYSIWPADRPPPDGWRAEGFRGAKDACLSHIGRVWRDLRPLSAREEPAEESGDPRGGGRAAERAGRREGGFGSD